jgi:hypothetical protein
VRFRFPTAAFLRAEFYSGYVPNDDDIDFEEDLPEGSLDAGPDWTLREWLARLEITQAELDRATGWGKRKTSFLVNGHQPYNRYTLNQAARALGLRPHELLIEPDEAILLRQLSESVHTIARAAETRAAFRAHEAGQGDRLAPPGGERSTGRRR